MQVTVESTLRIAHRPCRPLRSRIQTITRAPVVEPVRRIATDNLQVRARRPIWPFFLIHWHHASRSHPPPGIARRARGLPIFQSSNCEQGGRHPPPTIPAIPAQGRFSPPGLAWPHLPPTTAPSCSEPAHWPLRVRRRWGRWIEPTEASAQRKETSQLRTSQTDQCHVVAALARSQRPPAHHTHTTSPTPRPAPVARRLSSVACCSLCLVRPRLQAQPCP